MTDAPNPYQAMTARLAADPGMAVLAAPGTGVLVWDRDAEKLLWASPAAEGLGGALADETGRLRPDFRARERLKALASDPSLMENARLERLRLDPARPGLPGRARTLGRAPHRPPIGLRPPRRSRAARSASSGRPTPRPDSPPSRRVLPRRSAPWRAASWGG